MPYGGFLAGPPAIGFVADHLTLRGGLGVVVLLALVIFAMAHILRPRSG